MPVLSYIHQLFNADQCQAYTKLATTSWLIVSFGECGTGLQSHAVRPLSRVHADSCLIFCCKYQDM
jgi:hypothetical protein